MSDPFPVKVLLIGWYVSLSKGAVLSNLTELLHVYSIF